MQPRHEEDSALFFPLVAISSYAQGAVVEKQDKLNSEKEKAPLTQEEKTAKPNIKPKILERVTNLHWVSLLFKVTTKKKEKLKVIQLSLQLSCVYIPFVIKGNKSMDDLKRDISLYIFNNMSVHNVIMEEKLQNNKHPLVFIIA